jgi:hypothetical protein
MGSDRTLGAARRPASLRVRTAILLLVLAWSHVGEATPNESADELLKRAIALATSGRLKDAEQLLIEGKSIYERDARFPIELAGVAWRKKESAGAKRYLRQGLRLDPAGAYANEFLGSLYLLDGNLYAALKYWNRIRRPMLSGVTFTPEPPLQPELRERLPAASAGQLLTGARLAQTERNLDRLHIFSDPRFELAPVSDNEYALTVRAPVMSQPLAGAAGHLLPLLRSIPYQALNFDWLNIKQRAISLTSLWRWDADKRRIAVQYRAPLMRGSYSVWTDLRDEEWNVARNGLALDGIGIRSAALGGEIEFELAQGSSWTPSVYLSRHTFRNGGSQDWLLNTTVWEVRNRFALPRWRYPERRVLVDSSVTLRTGRVFSRASSRLVGSEFDAGLRWLPQQRDDVYSVRARLRAGVLTGNLPVDELYTTAMERDNDLWLRGHVGTRHGRKGNAPMGTRFVVSQSDTSRRLLRMPFLRVDAGPFFDVANVGGPYGLSSRGWLYDTGVQATISTLGGFRFTVVYGRDLRVGNNVVYTAVSRRD